MKATDQMPCPILETKDLRTWFPIRRGVLSRTVGFVRAVDGVSLRIEPGETVGLVGESGCGKTTLARTIMRLDPAHAGSIMFKGNDIIRAGRRYIREMRGDLQIVFQDPFSSLNPRMTVRDIVTEGVREHSRSTRDQLQSLAEELLSDVGLNPNTMYRYPHEFSGGQRQRISIARALAVKPSLVLLDEAVSALDVSVQAQVINLLMDLRDKYSLSYLFISHDLSVVHHVSDRIAVMYLGRIVEYGKSRDIVEQPRHPYTRALISAVPTVGGDPSQRIVLQGDVPSPSAPPPGCPFHPRCQFATDRCSREEPKLATATADSANGRLSACIRRDEI